MIERMKRWNQRVEDGELAHPVRFWGALLVVLTGIGFALGDVRTFTAVGVGTFAGQVVGRRGHRRRRRAARHLIEPGAAGVAS